MAIIGKIANKIGDYNRLRKYNIFMDYFKPGANTKILDVGASEREYQKNANIIEKRYPYPENITALGIEDYKEFRKRYPKVKVMKYDGSAFPIKDKGFDISWCNAVIEHVGTRERQREFLKELHRVSKAVFITTPRTGIFLLKRIRGSSYYIIFRSGFSIRY